MIFSEARFLHAMVAGLLFGAASLSPNPVSADGAIAIGRTSSVAEDGVAFGFSTSQSPQDAAAKALERCREPDGASTEARELCKIVKSFKARCVAVSMDPEDATPGFGWAVADDMQTAESDAMTNCNQTAGRRAGACKLEKSACDTVGGTDAW